MHAKFSKKAFFEKFGVLYFLVTIILKDALLPYYRRHGLSLDLKSLQRSKGITRAANNDRKPVITGIFAFSPTNYFCIVPVNIGLIILPNFLLCEI